MRIILSILLLSLVLAQTDVSGVISSNTTWVVSSSPYIVTGNILINESGTLTIEPEVTIKVDSNNEFQVKGALIAKGTSSSKIIFTSNLSNPNAGDWNYFKLVSLNYFLKIESIGKGI